MFQYKPDDKKETETSKEKKLSFLDNLKSIRILPSFLSKKQSKVEDIEAGDDKVEESKQLLEKKKGENVETTLWLEFQSFVQKVTLIWNNLYNTYILKTYFYLGGEEGSPKEIKETPSEEPVPQSENDTAQEEENQSVQFPPVLSSQISIPLDWIL